MIDEILQNDIRFSGQITLIYKRNKTQVKFKNQDHVNQVIEEMTRVCKDYIKRYNKGENIEIALVKHFYKKYHFTQIDSLKNVPEEEFKQTVKNLISENKNRGKNIQKTNYSINS